MKQSNERRASYTDGIDADFAGRIEADILRRFGNLEDEAARQELQELTEFFTGFREQLLGEADYLDDDAVIGLMSRSGEVELLSEELATLRQQRELVAVHDHGRWLYPDFQFDQSTGTLFSTVKEVAHRFVEDENEWGILYWWLTPSAELDGVSPAQALQSDYLRSRIVDILPELV